VITLSPRSTADVSDVELNWNGVLGDAAISSITTVSVSPVTSPPLVPASPTFTDTTTTHWLSGGVDGKEYTLGRSFTRSILVPVGNG
jgi:hypothetical protein